jgi:hypothetical protein
MARAGEGRMSGADRAVRRERRRATTHGLAGGLAALLLAACSVLPPPSGREPAVVPAGAPTATASGVVRDVSPDGRTFTLHDGLTLRWPNPPAFVRDDLQPEAFVRAEYARVGGENVVTSITIHKPYESEGRE